MEDDHFRVAAFTYTCRFMLPLPAFSYIRLEVSAYQSEKYYHFRSTGVSYPWLAEAVLMAVA